MRFGRSFSLSEARSFPVKKSVIRASFDNFEALSCHFGSLSDHFKFDHRCFHPPKLHGLVVASVSFSRQRTAIMQLYPILKEGYSAEAHAEFEIKVVPHLRQWLTDQFEKPETAILGHEQMIVTWNGSMHAYTAVKFL